MNDTYIERRLRSLYNDLNHYDELAANNLISYCDTQEEREEIIRNMYIKDFSPVRISASAGFTSGAKDRLMIYEEFVSGYEGYLDETIEEYQGLIRRKEEAYKLLSKILSLPGAMTKVLYYTYVRRMTVDEVCSNLFMSRSTYFRYRRAAIRLLEEMLGKEPSSIIARKTVKKRQTEKKQ